MDTIVAHSNFLKGLLMYLTRDIFTPALVLRCELFLENKPSYDPVPEQEPYISSIHSLINELSANLQMPDKLVGLFNKETFKMQMFLYDRYLLALEYLDPEQADHDRYPVPIRLDELFKWFFITLWGD